MIRPYQPGDHEAIAEVFTRAIHEIASQRYTTRQCEAWSGRKPNPEHWRQRCDTKQPLVYVVDGQVAGFLELDPDGHIDCLFVHPAHGRRGIASALVRRAIETCVAKGLPLVYVEASLCARPLFEAMRFVTLRENVVRIGDEKLVNFSMELRLVPEGSSSATY
ncbi:GNAT family N-acetyltransferase [Botrimarina mediterranea]|uniref:Putative N-acetyltransferase YafP n=1 Tax=Botrimarina mediterranea TaxID=2528022 RepID=A0A518K9I4_9BACT|nr:GNAT family N-acetyltransferase [Botrimarina mediterranea]QDV74454.1 putative N-acetyltransferase YafP [Botrimarina mediterranea]